MTRKSLCKSTLSDSKLTLHGRRLTTWSREHPQSYDAFTAACVQWTCLPCKQVHVGRGHRNNGPGETTASAAATLCKYKQLMPFKAMHRRVKGSDMRPCTVGLTGALLTRYHSQHRPSITQESFSWDHTQVPQVNVQCLTTEPRLLFRIQLTENLNLRTLRHFAMYTHRPQKLNYHDYLHVLKYLLFILFL